MLVRKDAVAYGELRFSRWPKQNPPMNEGACGNAQRELRNSLSFRLNTRPEALRWVQPWESTGVGSLPSATFGHGRDSSEDVVWVEDLGRGASLPSPR